MERPNHDGSDGRQDSGARGRNPGADLLWQLVGITLVGIAVAVIAAWCAG